MTLMLCLLPAFRQAASARYMILCGAPGHLMVDLGKVKILHKGFPMSYEMFRRYKEEADDEDEVKSYAELVGKSSRTILLYRQ